MIVPEDWEELESLFGFQLWRTNVQISLHHYSSGGFQSSAANSDCDKWENGGQLLKAGVNYSKIGDFLRQLPLKW